VLLGGVFSDRLTSVTPVLDESATVGLFPPLSRTAMFWPVTGIVPSRIRRARKERPIISFDLICIFVLRDEKEERAAA
jgi:hypothetical protein